MISGRQSNYSQSNYSNDGLHPNGIGFSAFAPDIKQPPPSFKPFKNCVFDVARVILRSEQRRKEELRPSKLPDALMIDVRKTNIDNVWSSLR